MTDQLSTPPPNFNQTEIPDPKTAEGQSVIEGYISALKTLCKDKACYELIKPKLLDFNDEISDDDEIAIVKKNEEKEMSASDELSKPFKAASKCPFTKRIINFTAPNHRMPTNAKIYDGTSDPADHITRFTGMGNSAEWPMPVWCRMFQQTLDGKARAWFDKLPSGSIDSWDDLEEKFLNRFGMLKACDKDPTEITKIVRRANEALPNFRERWVSESNAIPNVPELMRISSFMSSHKCPELSKRFSDSIPRTVDEMLRRVDDYVRSEEAFKNTELPKGEFQKREAGGQWTPRNDRPHRVIYGGGRRRPDQRPLHKAQEHYAPYVAPHRPNNDFRCPRENKVILTLGSLISTPAEILATEHHLNLPQPAPLVGIPSKENIHKFCDYHNEKGHSTNDCFVLKKQLEKALETGKLNHLIKDVRQRGNKGQKHNGSKNAVINMVRNHDLDRKRKTTITDESWMNVPITFPPVPARDLSDEALVMEAEIEGYLVRRIHIDEGASIEIMYEHCFNMLHPKIKARLTETQTTVSGFSGERVKPLGKIELDVCFGGAGRCRRAMMRFTVIPAPSPYNIILGRPALKQLRAIPSTIHGMMKFPTRWGIATVLSQTPTILECRREEKKQAREKEKDPVEEVKSKENPSPTELVLVNPAYPEQLVKIGTNLSPEGSTQLKNLLKKTKIYLHGNQQT
ncbi:reverse transcriptase domain-containing protein [Tanacetum coccineum]